MKPAHITKRLILILTALLLVAACAYQAIAARAPLAMVTGIYGSLNVIQDTKKKNGAIRMKLYQDDVASTDSRSKAAILLKDGSEIKLGPGTEVKITDKNGKKGLFVSLGKIFAKMMPQKSNFQIQSPYGAAAIEGTQLQVEVAPSLSSVTVAEGKVNFSNQKNAMKLQQGEQSSSSSLTAALSPAKKVQLQILIRWQGDIKKYYDAIPEFIDAFNQAQASKNASGTGSLYGAQAQVQRMKELLELLDTIVPDDKMLNGHRKLKSAFNLMIQSLVMTNPATSQQFLTQAQADLTIAQNELNKWKLNYDNEERQFLKP